MNKRVLITTYFFQIVMVIGTHLLTDNTLKNSIGLFLLSSPVPAMLSIIETTSAEELD